MAVAILIIVCCLGTAASLVSYWILQRNNRRLTEQNVKITSHLERLTFAFVAKIPDALSDTVIYDKIGQQIGIQRLVVDLYDRVMSDPELAPFFTGVDMDKLRAHQVSMYRALFGLEPYEGLDLSVVHSGLGIQTKHFDRLMRHVNASLVSFGLSDSEINKVYGWLESNRANIVNA